MSEGLKEQIITLGTSATGIINKYLDGGEEDGKKVDRAIRILNNSTKILHMNQVKELRERSHAIQLLKFLPNDGSRLKYIKIMNPVVGELMLESRPKTDASGA